MQHLFKFLILVVLFSSCKKEFHFSKDEITETDASGNLVGNINPNDWLLKPLSEANEFDKNVFSQLLIGDSTRDVYKLYNTNCVNDYDFSLVAYPNPMPKKGGSGYLNLKMITNLEYSYFYKIIVDKFGAIIESGAGLAEASFDKIQINPLIKRDFILYYIFIDENNCAFFGKGNVIGSKK
ncbi:MAG: hypothetical protein IPO64_10405 [Bacteroidetes bacterium]|jgi:hypothetical protein|nr:hypothetical protein [Bacteroidota bacterium]MBL0077880.1 hypothetical protein [Bacteroidota bacterium]MBL0288883.1 hypothetical protein [Bacteroidota bacterium]MBP6661317.1 hypothetical protein [Chitinophagales bacterium]